MCHWWGYRSIRTSLSRFRAIPKRVLRRSLAKRAIGRSAHTAAERPVHPSSSPSSSMGSPKPSAHLLRSSILWTSTGNSKMAARATPSSLQPTAVDAERQQNGHDRWRGASYREQSRSSRTIYFTSGMVGQIYYTKEVVSMSWRVGSTRVTFTVKSR